MQRSSSLATLAVAVALIATACSSIANPSSTPTLIPRPSVTPAFGLPARTSVTYGGREFAPTAGPIRADLLNEGQLTPTSLILREHEVRDGGGDGRPVYALPGVPLSEGFLVRSVERDFGPDTWVSVGNQTYPSCQPGAGAFVYVALGAPAPLPPYGPVTPQPAYPGGPTPTAIPTPATPVADVPLSAAGLLSAGWPHVSLERAQLTYGGTTYHFVSFRYINESGADSAIPQSTLEEVETLTLTYPVTIGSFPSPVLDQLVTGGPVTDRVQAYRFKDSPASQVLVVDQCPAGLRGDQFVFYQPVVLGPTPTP